MIRPRYETEQDRENEQSLIQRVAAKFRCIPHKIPMSYVLDYALVDDSGKIHSFWECKKRNCTKRAYSTIFVAYKKVQAAKSFPVPCGFAVQWEDETGFFDLKHPLKALTLEGRTDRGDAADIEPMAHFDISEARKI